MLVKDRMTRDPITINSDMPVSEALNLMNERRIRRLPIMNKEGYLEGIVSKEDLLQASPSSATSLSIHEIGYLLSKLKVAEIMTQKVVTIEVDAPIEEAALLMSDSKIGGLPVMQDGKMVGIITETDVFKVMLEMLGARDKGLRLSLELPDEPGQLSRVSGKIAAMGGDIVALGTFIGETAADACDTAVLTIKVRYIDPDALRQAMEDLGLKVRSILDV